jgi:hypothetical protein
MAVGDYNARCLPIGPHPMKLPNFLFLLTISDEENWKIFEPGRYLPEEGNEIGSILPIETILQAFSK